MRPYICVCVCVFVCYLSFFLSQRSCLALLLSSSLCLPLSPIANTVSYGVVEGKTSCLSLSVSPTKILYIFAAIFLCWALDDASLKYFPSLLKLII